ncbi:anoctamin-10-like [Paramacrobiotus metropolitanus]|uniref:anoctamin-10-like n=1 Tax=Paramacrobiotus metropolitanus TaxID=2943436 RepID=UPI0024461A7C|nr:anoctamin-10-like [Paramacrobiotus metropolitanus]
MESTPEPEEIGGQGPFETHCVIELSSRCTEDLVNWIIWRIRAPKRNQGAELLVRAVRDVDTNKYAFLHICAPTYRVLELAEWLEVMKPDAKDGTMKEFSIASLSSFVPEDEDPGNLFTYSEKARFVNFEINELRAKAEEMEKFFESDKLRFSEGQSIITKMQRKDVILKIFPLHEKELRKRLFAGWVGKKLSRKQPLDAVRDYFGEHIAIYFAFLGFYTEMLIPATILGLTMFTIQLFSQATLTTVAAFAIFNLLWATFFFERWKRFCNRLCYKWGVLFKTNEQLEIPRSQFKGSMGKNPVTGLPEPVYPEMTRYIWIAFISTPIVVLCLFLSLFMLGSYLDAQTSLNDQYIKRPTFFLFFGRFAPSAIYTVCVNIFKGSYRYVATWLTDKENHRLQTSYEFHLIWKLLLFNFVNSFSSLFFIAFWLQDLDLLRSHLGTQLITNQIIDQFSETIFPFMKVRYQKWQLQRELRKENKKREIRGENEDANFTVFRDQAIIENDQPIYKGTFDDYLELFLQFGYAFMFSSAFPVAPLFALLNNVVEIRGDGFKLCNIMQRPFARPGNSIGPWQLAFELMGFAAVVTNLALVYLNPIVTDYAKHTGHDQMILIFVVIEHILIFAKLGMSVILPTVPREVQLEIARSEYEMKTALKERRAGESRRALTSKKFAGSELSYSGYRQPQGEFNK